MQNDESPLNEYGRHAGEFSAENVRDADLDRANRLVDENFKSLILPNCTIHERLEYLFGVLQGWEEKTTEPNIKRMFHQRQVRLQALMDRMPHTTTNIHENAIAQENPVAHQSSKVSSLTHSNMSHTPENHPAEAKASTPNSQWKPKTKIYTRTEWENSARPDSEGSFYAKYLSIFAKGRGLKLGSAAVHSAPHTPKTPEVSHPAAKPDDKKTDPHAKDGHDKAAKPDGKKDAHGEKGHH